MRTDDATAGGTRTLDLAVPLKVLSLCSVSLPSTSPFLQSMNFKIV